jgi:hypothetical protein
MDRYGIILGKEPPPVKEPLSVERPGVCAFCSHGETYCREETVLKEPITRDGFTWDPYNILCCTREKGHAGPHVACSLDEHNLKMWEIHWSGFSLFCTRELGHAGPHVACSRLNNEHNLARG